MLLIEKEHELKLKEIDREKAKEMFEIKEKEQLYEIKKNIISKCDNLDMNGVEKLLKILNPSQNSQQQNNMIPQQQPIPFIYNNNVDYLFIYTSWINFKITTFRFNS